MALRLVQKLDRDADCGRHCGVCVGVAKGGVEEEEAKEDEDKNELWMSQRKGVRYEAWINRISADTVHVTWRDLWIYMNLTLKTSPVLLLFNAVIKLGPTLLQALHQRRKPSSHPHVQLTPVRDVGLFRLQVLIPQRQVRTAPARRGPVAQAYWLWQTL